MPLFIATRSQGPSRGGHPMYCAVKSAPRAPSRMPSMRRKRSRRRRSPAKAIFRSRTVGPKQSFAIVAHFATTLPELYDTIVRIGKLIRSACSQRGGNVCSSRDDSIFSVLPTFKAGAKPLKMQFIFLPLQGNREFKVLCSCHSIAFETEATRSDAAQRRVVIARRPGWNI